MSVAEIIEAIKKLPTEERAEVQEFMQNVPPAINAVEYASDVEFDRAAKLVLAENQELLRRLAQ